MIVLDASAAVDYLIGGPAFERIRARVDKPGQALHAPHLLDLEVAQALHRLTLREAVSAERADEALWDLADLRLTRYPHAALLPRVWELRANMSVFDAAYVALAETLDVPLITTDARLARTPGHRAMIDLLA